MQLIYLTIKTSNCNTKALELYVWKTLQIKVPLKFCRIPTGAIKQILVPLGDV